MEHGEELKNNLDQAANMEEAKDIIAKAGMHLTDDEVGDVAGGRLQDFLDKEEHERRRQLAELGIEIDDNQQESSQNSDRPQPMTRPVEDRR